MSNNNAVSILRQSGPGTKDRRAALALEFFATLDATHGNSAQARSLNAIAERALVRLNRRLEKKAAKAAAKAETEAPAAKSKTAKSKTRKSKTPRKSKTEGSVECRPCLIRVPESEVDGHVLSDAHLRSVDALAQVR